MKKSIVYISVLLLLMLQHFSAQTSSWDDNTPILVYGIDNCGFGYNALNNVGFGPENTATGFQALTNNMSGSYNTGIGKQALHFNAVGNNHTAGGYRSLYNNGCAICIGGNNNTAIGVESLLNNTDGNRNTAFGAASLRNNTIGNDNTAFGYQALKNNNTLSGINGEENTAIGANSLRENISGIQNTAVGTNALMLNRYGFGNTALGFETLLNSDNYFTNTAAGHSALKANTNGNGNNAIGVDALTANTTGNDNIACGYQSLKLNLVGNGNVGIGREALASNVSETGNVAIGSYALQNANGEGNTAIGELALLTSGSGKYNTAAGYNALNQTLIGDYNTCLGSYSNLNGNFGGASAIGYQAIVNANNKMRIGDSNPGTIVETQFNYSTVSDGRFKINIDYEAVKGLEFIMRLRPVEYTFNHDKYMNFLISNYPDSLKTKYLNTREITTKVIRQSGFIAQEVEKAAFDCGYDFSGLIKPSNANDNYALSYGTFVVPLVQAVKEQQLLIEAGQKANQTLELKLKEQNLQINNLMKGTSNLVNINKVGNESTGFSMDAQPNPFKNETTIHYFLPEHISIENAYLIICTLSGKQVAKYAVQESEKGSLRINLASVAPGIYFYTFIADGNILGSKRLIIADN